MYVTKSYHIFFIHSSVNGHLYHLHVLAIVDSSTMKTGVPVSFGIMFVSGYIPRSGIVQSYNCSIFSFLMEALCYSPQWLYQFAFSPTV